MFRVDLKSGESRLILSLAAFLLFGFQGFYAKVAMKSMIWAG